MITIEIGNKKSNISDKTLSVDLPASGYDLQDAFEKLGIQDTSGCKMVNAITDIGELDMYFDSEIFETEDIPKLNVLAMILNGMDDHDLDVFSALLFKDEPQTIEEIICIAAHIDDALLEDIYSKRELGRFLVDESYIDIPAEVLDFISYKKVAKFYLKHSDCALTPYGFIDDVSELCEECDSCHGNEIVQEIFESISEIHDMIVFHVTLTPKNMNKSGKSAVVLIPLPAADEVLIETAKILGAGSVENLSIANVQSRNKFFDPLFDSNTDIKLLNEFAKILINMDIDIFCKYKAVLEYNEVIGKKAHSHVSNAVLSALIVESNHLDSYDFVPLTDGKSPESACGEQTNYGFIHYVPERSPAARFENERGSYSFSAPVLPKAKLLSRDTTMKQNIVSNLLQ